MLAKVDHGFNRRAFMRGAPALGGPVLGNGIINGTQVLDQENFGNRGLDTRRHRDPTHGGCRRAH